MKKASIWGVCSLLCVGLLGGCGGSSSAAGGAADSTASDISTVVPSDVVMSSPTAEASSATLNLARKTLKATGDAEGNDFLAKREALQALITGDGDCAFTVELPDVSSPDCYGPTVSYTGHPDVGGGQNQPNGQMPIGDVGIWNTTDENDAACSAAKMNELVDKIAAYVDNAIKTVGSMACAGKKEDVSLPAVSDTPTDLKAAMDDNVTATGLEVDSATLDRLPDSGGDAVYESTIAGTMTLSNDPKPTTIILTHIPTADDNSTYKGKLVIKMSSENSQFGNNCSGINQAAQQTGTTVAGTILYEKTSATSVTYEFNFAQFCGSDADPFDDNSNLDPTNAAAQNNQQGGAPTNPNGWADNWNYGLFNFDPTTGSGNFAYAWQAGTGDQRTRVLNLSTEADADGNVTGTAYYGFGPAIATATALTKGTIDGFVCNWAGPNGAISLQDRTAANLATLSGDTLSIAQKQTFSRAAGDTIFTSDSANITYAVENDCTAAASDNFIYFSDDGHGQAKGYTNDRADDNAAVTPDLVPLSEITDNFTKPTPPDDI